MGKVKMKQSIVDMLLEITPKCVHHIEILTSLFDRKFRGQAVCRISKNPPTKTFFIRTPPPLESSKNLLVFLHECAHITLGHVNGDPNTLLPIHPHYNTYSNEIMAWAKVDRWLEQYDIAIKGKRAHVQSSLEFAWDYHRSMET